MYRHFDLFVIVPNITFMVFSDCYGMWYLNPKDSLYCKAELKNLAIDLTAIIIFLSLLFFLFSLFCSSLLFCCSAVLLFCLLCCSATLLLCLLCCSAALLLCLLCLLCFCSVCSVCSAAVLLFL